MQQRVLGVVIGVGLVLHGLGHAVLPMRAADVVATGVVAPAMTALYVIAMVGFVAAGLGVLGVVPLARGVIPLAIVAALCGLVAQVAHVEAGLWPGIVLSTTLPVLAALYVTVFEVSAPRPPRPAWKRAGDVVGVLFLSWVAASAALWPWHRGWGTAPSEWSMTLPGDNAPRTPRFEILHAVTIDAPPSMVWPWLVQIGHDRAGFYSYDWLERLFLADVHNVKEVRPEWQARQAGERVYATQESYLGGMFGNRPGWTVSLVEPEHALVLENWGAFVLLPTPDGRTRFLIRSTMSNERIPIWAAAVNLTAFQLPHFIMQRKMMLTIKALAEGENERRG
jgi:hypothetical protein